MSIYTNSQTVNMISNVKSQSIVNVETGTKVFSVINCIITGVMSMSVFVTTLVYLIIPNKEYALFIELVLVAFLVLFVFGFGFGIVLAIGAFVRKIKFMKTYFIYGIIMNVLTFILALASLVCWSINYEANYVTYVSIGVIFFCVVYSAILYMIWKTINKYRKEIQYQHKMLPEARY